MNENNTNVIVNENNDYADTKGEKISKLLWWLLGVTAARLLFSFYELTGGYVPVPNYGNQAVYWLFSVVAAIVLILLGKYGKFYRISGILMVAFFGVKLIMPFTRGWFLNPVPDADANNFLEMLNGLTQAGPIYKLLNTLNPYLLTAAFILAFIAHKTFSKPLDEKISKGWMIALILHLGAIVVNYVYNTIYLMVGSFPKLIHNSVDVITDFSNLAGLALQIVLLYFMAKKAKEIE